LPSTESSARAAAESFRASILAGNTEAIAARILPPGFVCANGDSHDFPSLDNIVGDLRRGSGTWYEVFFGSVNPYPGRGRGVPFRRWFLDNPSFKAEVTSAKFGEKGEQVGYEVAFCSSSRPDRCAYPMWLFLVEGKWWLGFGTGCM
jgi:hypothetical protein